MCSSNSDLHGMRDLILNSKKPLLFKNYLSDWEPLQWPLSKWCQFEEPLPIRCGRRACSEDPQWEVSCQMKQMDIKLFLSSLEDPCHEESEEWLYFDYKHLVNWKLQSWNDSLPFPWERFGFGEQREEESTLWIGSGGAHTPCHADTYGCNLVAQVIGRKQWILFDPLDEHIGCTRTRVPYEESSIYSRVNFYCGRALLESSISKADAYVITLEPGDVLYVPNGWWHYVEHLTPAVSMNTWIPNKDDETEVYLNETLVKYIVDKFTQQLSKEQKLVLFNSNEMDPEDNIHNLSRIQYYASNLSRSTNPSSSLEFTSLLRSASLPQNVFHVQIMSKEEFRKFCVSKCHCCRQIKRKQDQTNDHKIKKRKSSVDGCVSTNSCSDTRQLCSCFDKGNSLVNPNSCNDTRQASSFVDKGNNPVNPNSCYDTGQVFSCVDNRINLVNPNSCNDAGQVSSFIHKGNNPVNLSSCDDTGQVSFCVEKGNHPVNSSSCNDTEKVSSCVDKGNSPVNPSSCHDTGQISSCVDKKNNPINRNSCSHTGQVSSSELITIKHLINAFTDPDVLAIVKTKLCKETELNI